VIVEMLETHYAAPFPEGYRGREVANVNLAMLDADVAALASSYLSSRGLSAAQRLILEGCASDAERLLPLLVGDARTYFARVHELASAVLHAADDAPAG
jgi:hypothetical protein